MIDSIAAAFSGTAQPLDYLEKHANVSIVVNNSRFLREAVKNLEVSLAFVVEDSVAHPGLEIIPMGVESFMVVCHPDYLAKAQAELDKGIISQFICYDQLSVTYQLIYQKLQKLDVTIQPTFFSTSPDVMKRMILRGKHVAALPYLMIEELLTSGELTPLKKRGQIITIDRPISLVRVNGKVLPKALGNFSRQAKITLNSIKHASDRIGI
jgi:DNA-binding transcriptional LysR family regulator